MIYHGLWELVLSSGVTVCRRCYHLPLSLAIPMLGRAL